MSPIEVTDTENKQIGKDLRSDYNDFIEHHLRLYLSFVRAPHSSGIRLLSF
jgi:hypothetical protein